MSEPQVLPLRQRAIKRCFDLIMAILLLVVSWPVILVAVLAATADTRAPGLFRQTRVGRYGKLFSLYKVRTMRPTAQSGTTVTVRGDARITRLGAALRRTKIDELPQLVNVVCGNMSMVGPRPDVPGFADLLEGDDRLILSVRPGITSPAALAYKDEEALLATVDDPVTYNREVIWPDKVRINRAYLDRYRLAADLRVILATALPGGSAANFLEGRTDRPTEKYSYAAKAGSTVGERQSRIAAAATPQGPVKCSHAERRSKMIQDDLSTTAQGYWRNRMTIGGAFRDIDLILFDRFLSFQRGSGAYGDLLEIGVLRGKSAVVLGLHAKPDETFIACDVFEDPGNDDANTLENHRSYAGLTKTEFLNNYAQFVSTPPKVICGLSSSVPNHIKPESLRFAHIDGGHLYDIVRNDLQNAKPLMNQHGILVMDDFRAIHTPGVAAATWNAVVNDGLIPICMSEFKFYGTWSADLAQRHLADLTQWLQEHPSINTGVQRLAGHEALIIGTPSISNRRSVAKSLLPPLIVDRIRYQAAPHLGE